MKLIRKKIKDIPIDKLFSFTPESEPLDYNQQREILDIIGISSKISSSQRYVLIDEIDWRPMSASGSLVKRLKSKMYKDFSIKLSPSILEKLGAYINANIVATKEYALDVTKTFDWEAGDFGDGGSCFWAGRSAIRKDMMADGRFKSLRFFVKDTISKTRKGLNKYHDTYAGIGRSWLWTTKVQEQVSKTVSVVSDVYVIFNGYGPGTKWQAQFLSAYIGLPMKLVSIKNKGQVSGGLYVNNGEGYIIGEGSVIEQISQLDLGMDIHHYGKND